MFDFKELNFDSNGDGVNDSYMEEFDTDGDGVADMWLIDTDGDMVADQELYDTNYDGVVDTWANVNDLDGDGITDNVTVWYDSDQDGIAETGVMQYDDNQDGIIDRITTSIDTDGDGIRETYITTNDYDYDGEIDLITQSQFLDTDGDGDLDTYIFNVDEDGDFVFDAGKIENLETGEVTEFDYSDYEPDLDYESDPDYDTDYEAEEEPEELYLEPTEDYDDNDNGMYYQDLENFDPDNADPDKVIGDPEDAMDEWEYQGNTNRCAIYSQKFIIEEFTDQELDIEDMADIAEENGWFTEEGGTPLVHMNKLLDYYGVENEMSYGNDMEDIKDCLEDGGRVIVAIDADEIWYGENDNVYVPADGVNHAVEVIGIDWSNPEEPMVIINDSGSPSGNGSMIPLDTFMDAWEDGNCQMITCIE